MSENALRDLNTLPGSERKNESSSKGSLTKPYGGNPDENVEEWQRKNSTSLVSAPVNGDGTVNPGVEIGNLEVEYIESENLSDVEDVDTSVKVSLWYLSSQMLCALDIITTVGQLIV